MKLSEWFDEARKVGKRTIMLRWRYVRDPKTGHLLREYRDKKTGELVRPLKSA